MKNFGWLKYRYPALNEAELEMEASLRDLERTEARKRFRQRLYEESVDDDIRFSITGHINESINANYPPEPCADLSINDSLPYRSASRRTTVGPPAIFNFWGERSTPEYLLPKRGFVTRTRVVSAKGARFTRGLWSSFHSDIYFFLTDR